MSHFASGMINAGNSSDASPPTFVSASADGGGDSAAMPSGWAAGDLLLIVATSYIPGSLFTGGHDTPTGWTLLGSYTHRYLNNTHQTRVRVFYRIAESGDPTVTLTTSDGSTRHSSCMLAYRGVDAASPFDAVGPAKNNQAASSTPSYEQLAIGANCTVLQVISCGAAGSVSSTPGAGWTERVEMGGAFNLAIDERTFTSAGTTPAGNQTKSVSMSWGRIAFAIKPA